ncbi:related to dynamin GTPase [Cephalotrichum gorgonifer]|uniref:Related to dynamin GTPase n=1 Tax=Cephalotrichum gorgonifer TaxID=2041049 RepID=A0AAE8N0W7_9PEZI|nr:related to dynamin GTPase [Cephalotrichum gorgonifer]
MPTITLGSPKSTYRLNLIDKIRAKGVGDHVSLPQLVVCGDQSTGKSSVLERVAGVPFPQQEGLCTRFPTEIILRHTSEPLRVPASITPSAGACPETRQKLQAYHRELSDLSGLPSVIGECAALMGIRGYCSSEHDGAGAAFSPHVLRIEMVGDTGLHLTIVDLPGLVSVSVDEGGEKDGGDGDVRVVTDMVEGYLKSSRTIIMAVIKAGNDVANQRIVQLARTHDPEGQRTVGIITKPDLINEGAKGQIARLEDVEEELASMGMERSTVGDVRSFLTGLSMRFYQLARAALDGNYRGPDWEFFGMPDTRLRAMIHKANGEYANRMVAKGHLRKVRVYMDSRGRELPGSQNPYLVEELFHEHSSPWRSLAEAHLRDILTMVSQWVQKAIDYTVPEAPVDRQIRTTICDGSMYENERRAKEELGKLIEDEKLQPITYNHYYTDTIQKARQDKQSETIRAGVDSLDNYSLRETERVVEAVHSGIVTDIDEQACSEALERLESYYKMAMKTFVDNVCRQVIERHVLVPLPSLFCPTTVSKLSDEVLLRVGSEPEIQRARRAELGSLAQALRQSLVELRGTA